MPIFSPHARLVSVCAPTAAQAIPTGVETAVTFSAPTSDELAAFQTPGLFQPAMGNQAFYRGDVWLQIAGVAGAGEYWIRLAAVQNGPGGNIVSKIMIIYNQDAFDKFIALPIRASGIVPMAITLEHSAGANRTISGGRWSMTFEGF